MGYVRKQKTITLAFEDAEYAGLEVKMRRLSTGDYLKVQALQELTEETAASTEELLLVFASNLVDWNLEEDVYGQTQPVPMTLDGVKSQDLDFVLHVIGAWLQGMGGVSAPLEQPSHDGSTQLEASIPMATLSLPPES